MIKIENIFQNLNHRDGKGTSPIHCKTNTGLDLVKVLEHVQVRTLDTVSNVTGSLSTNDEKTDFRYAMGIFDNENNAC